MQINTLELKCFYVVCSSLGREREIGDSYSFHIRIFVFFRKIPVFVFVFYPNTKREDLLVHNVTLLMYVYTDVLWRHWRRDTPHPCLRMHVCCSEQYETAGSAGSQRTTQNARTRTMRAGSGRKRRYRLEYARTYPDRRGCVFSILTCSVLRLMSRACSSQLLLRIGALESAVLDILFRIQI